MSKPKYEGWIHAEKLVRPIGNVYFYVAKVRDFGIRMPDGTLQRIADPIGECMGEDASEARARASTALSEWIVEQDGEAGIS